MEKASESRNGPSRKFKRVFSFLNAGQCCNFIEDNVCKGMFKVHGEHHQLLAFHNVNVFFL